MVVTLTSSVPVCYVAGLGWGGSEHHQLQVTVLMGTFSAVSDFSVGDRRTSNVAKVEGCLFLGVGAGAAAFGQVVKLVSLEALFVLVAALFLVGFVWVLVAIPETLPAHCRKPFPGLLKANTLSTVLSLRRNRVTMALTGAFAMQCCTYFGLAAVEQLYTTHRLQWTPVT